MGTETQYMQKTITTKDHEIIKVRQLNSITFLYSAGSRTDSVVDRMLEEKATFEEINNLKHLNYIGGNQWILTIRKGYRWAEEEK